MQLVPENAEISIFKDDICHQLEIFSGVIDNLKLEMQELTEANLTITQVGYIY